MAKTTKNQKVEINDKKFFKELDKIEEKSYPSVVENMKNEEIEPIRKTINVQDTYLPAVLVRLKISKNNADARKLIRNGISVNGNIVSGCDFTTNLKQFNINYDNVIYEIIKF